MEFTDWLIIKFIVLVIAAFIWGIYCGATVRPLDPQEWEGNGKQ